tara:strand:+ start:110 stop:1153 length:1044 start_codon:yes stop_codon:yes gene_type:complete
MSNQPPIEVPQGAIRLNTDSQKLEFFAQDRWYEMATDVPTLDGGVRGVHNIGNFSPTLNTLNYITIPTAGNSTDFGDSTQARVGGSAPSSRTRGLFAGGSAGAPGYASLNIIDFITFSSTGNAQDFGDLTDPHDYGRNNISSGTRGVMAGGWPANSDIIDFVTIASLGNALDFGNLNENMGGGPPGASSPTRGVFCGGYHPNPSPLVTRDTLQFVTIATKGNTQDFGDLLTSRAHAGVCGNSTRILISSGYTGSGPSTPHINSIEKITIATLGNATNFGDASHTSFAKGGTSSSTRGVFIGGANTSPGIVNNIEYNEISTEGDSVDFGDMTTSGAWIAATSNGHGGL